jgi:hypothetical protein
MTTPNLPIERVEGEITQDDQGNVVIGAPTAQATAKAHQPGGESEDED